MNESASAVRVEPMGKYNTTLIENVHPSDWQNPTPDGTYNLVVIGAGTTGLVTASAAAQLGAKVALIERDLKGGDCLNAGCVPSKGIIRSARVAATVRDAGEFGIDVIDAQTNFGVAMERMRRLRARIATTTRQRDFEISASMFFSATVSSSMPTRLPWVSTRSPSKKRLSPPAQKPRRPHRRVGSSRLFNE